MPVCINLYKSLTIEDINDSTQKPKLYSKELARYTDRMTIIIPLFFERMNSSFWNKLLKVLKNAREHMEKSELVRKCHSVYGNNTFSKLAYIDFPDILRRHWRKYHTGIHRARFMARETRKWMVGLRPLIFILSSFPKLKTFQTKRLTFSLARCRNSQE